MPFDFNSEEATKRLDNINKIFEVYGFSFQMVIINNQAVILFPAYEDSITVKAHDNILRGVFISDSGTNKSGTIVQTTASKCYSLGHEKNKFLYSLYRYLRGLPGYNIRATLYRVGLYKSEEDLEVLLPKDLIDDFDDKENKHKRVVCAICHQPLHYKELDYWTNKLKGGPIHWYEKCDKAFELDNIFDPYVQVMAKLPRLPKPKIKENKKVWTTN